MKKGAYADTIVKFYIGEITSNDHKLLLSYPDATSEATMLFGDRLSNAILKGKRTDPEYTYAVIITDLQYNYTESYYFSVIFVKNGRQNIYLNSTIRLNVTGRKCILWN